MKHIAILAYPGISLFHLSVPIAIFSDAANQIKPLFKVSVCAQQVGENQAMNGLSMLITHNISIIEKADIVIVPSWQPNVPPGKQLISLLTQAHAQQKLIVGLCLGAYALGYAGLLEHKPATTHWKYSDDFAKKFPTTLLSTNPLFVEEDNVITSAGSAAAIDCCLYIVKRFYGAKLANKIARVMVSAPIRSGGQNQFIEHPIVTSASDKRLTDLAAHISANLNEDYSLDKVANLCSMSTRSFSRHFKAAFGVNFSQWLTTLRVNYSLELLESTNLSITKIAQTAGFSTEQNYRKQFRIRFDTSPHQWRKLFSR